MPTAKTLSDGTALDTEDVMRVTHAKGSVLDVVPDGSCSPVSQDAIENFGKDTSGDDGNNAGWQKHLQHEEGTSTMILWSV